MDIKKQYLIYGFGIFLIVVIVIIFSSKSSLKNKENFSITLGTLSPQNRFYSKCTDNCYRNKTGDSSPGQFLWLCTDKCQDIANSRIAAGIPDLTEEEYQRHSFVKDIEIGQRGSLPHIEVKESSWNFNDFEGDYCLKDVRKWCEERICPFAKNEGCMESCPRVYSVQCGQGVTGGWMP